MKNSIKVLLIEDNRLEAHQLKHWLSAAVEVDFEVECADTVARALERLDLGGIDVILCDLNLPDSRGLDTFLRIHDRAPTVPIVMHTGTDDEAIGAQAVEKGAEDYLIKQQVDAPRLARVLRFAVSRRRARADRTEEANQPHAGRILGFLGAKGGAGTTTTALNVAVALAHQKKSVILAELRPSLGSLARSLNQEPPFGVWSLLDRASEQIGDREIQPHLSKGPAGVRILFGPQRVDQVREIEAGQAEALVKALSRMAEFVLLDLPCHPSPATEAAARLCQFLALVTERDSVSAFCAAARLDQLESWSIHRSQVGAIVVNRAELHNSMPLPELKSAIGCEFAGVVPHSAAALIRGHQDGVPLLLAQPEHAGSSAFGEIAKRLSTPHFLAMNF